MATQSFRQHVLVYSDERKRVHGCWDYHCLLMVEEHKREAFLRQLKSDREEVGYPNELKFSDLAHSGKGEKVELARRWMSHVLEEADSPIWKIYFSKAREISPFFSSDASPIWALF